MRKWLSKNPIPHHQSCRFALPQHRFTVDLESCFNNTTGSVATGIIGHLNLGFQLQIKTTGVSLYLWAFIDQRFQTLFKFTSVDKRGFSVSCTPEMVSISCKRCLVMSVVNQPAYTFWRFGIQYKEKFSCTSNSSPCPYIFRRTTLLAGVTDFWSNSRHSGVITWSHTSSIRMMSSIVPECLFRCLSSSSSSHGVKIDMFFMCCINRYTSGF